MELLLSEELEGLTGALFLKIRELDRIASPAREFDCDQGRRLWHLSERLSGVKFDKIGEVE